MMWRTYREDPDAYDVSSLSTIESYALGGLAVDADDSIVLVLPLFHIDALNAIMGTYLYRGGTMHLQPERTARTC